MKLHQINCLFDKNVLIPNKIIYKPRAPDRNETLPTSVCNLLLQFRIYILNALTANQPHTLAAKITAVSILAVFKRLLRILV
jgi:hypothetical protein